MQMRKQLHDDVKGNLPDEAACKGFEEISWVNLMQYLYRDILLFVLKQKSNKKIQGSREKAKISLVPLQRRKLTILHYNIYQRRLINYFISLLKIFAA